MTKMKDDLIRMSDTHVFERNFEHIEKTLSELARILNPKACKNHFVVNHWLQRSHNEIDQHVLRQIGGIDIIIKLITTEPKGIQGKTQAEAKEMKIPSRYCVMHSHSTLQLNTSRDQSFVIGMPGWLYYSFPNA